MFYQILLTAGLLIGVLAAGFIVARDPAFWLGLVMLIIKRLTPYILAAIRPKDLTPEQLERIRQGLDPYDHRPPGHGGSSEH